MPNETQNYLYIIGEKNEVLRFQNVHTCRPLINVYFGILVFQEKL